jgi:hypothetical protein
MGNCFAREPLTKAQQEIEDESVRQYGVMPDLHYKHHGILRATKAGKAYVANAEKIQEQRQGTGSVNDKEQMKTKLIKQGFTEQDAERIAEESFPTPNSV